MTPEQLRHAVAQIENTELQARVLRRSLDYGKEQEPMKTKRHIGRMAVVAAAAVLVLSVTAFAAVRSQTRVSWYAPEAETLSLDEGQEKLAELGSGLVLPEAFSNGYTFEGAQPHYTALGMQQEGSGDEIVFSFDADAETEGLSCVYEKEDERLCLRVAPAEDGTEASGDEIQEPSASQGSTEPEPAEEAHVTDLQFRYYEEPLVIECSGGDAEEGETITVVNRSVSWQQDGLDYELAQIEGGLSEEELLEMAREMCGQK